MTGKLVMHLTWHYSEKLIFLWAHFKQIAKGMGLRNRIVQKSNNQKRWKERKRLGRGYGSPVQMCKCVKTTPPSRGKDASEWTSVQQKARRKPVLKTNKPLEEGDVN